MTPATRTLSDVPDGRSPEEQPHHPFRYTGLGSVVASIDFAPAVPAAIATGSAAAYSRAVAEAAPTALFAFGAGLVAMAAVVIGSHTLLVSLMTPEYLEVLKRARGGLKSVSRPYLVIGWVCAIGALLSVVAALAWPAIPATSEAWSRAVRWITFGIPTGAAVWGMLGSAQLIGINTFHLEKRAVLADLIREVRERKNASKSA